MGVNYTGQCLCLVLRAELANRFKLGSQNRIAQRNMRYTERPYFPFAHSVLLFRRTNRLRGQQIQHPVLLLYQCHPARNPLVRKNIQLPQPAIIVRKNINCIRKRNHIECIGFKRVQQHFSLLFQLYKIQHHTI